MEIYTRLSAHSSVLTSFFDSKSTITSALSVMGKTGSSNLTDTWFWCHLKLLMYRFTIIWLQSGIAAWLHSVPGGYWFTPIHYDSCEEMLFHVHCADLQFFLQFKRALQLHCLIWVNGLMLQSSCQIFWNSDFHALKSPFTLHWALFWCLMHFY